MAEAEVGDDVYGEDPTVSRLEARAAELLGMEAALFVPSGTMGNAIAIRILTQRGDEVLAERRSHVVRYELSGMSVLSGVMPRMVDAPGGHLTPDHVRAAVAPRAYYKSDVSLVVLENTHNLGGGTVQGVEEMQAVVAAARECGFRVHVDGARIWNAAVALGVPPSALVKGADTVMACFSKGLCAPVGSILASSRERIEEARRARKLLGGGMRQAGVLAAAGLVALDTLVPRLAEDHANARLLADALGRGRGVPSPRRDEHRRRDARGPRCAGRRLGAADAGVLAIAMDARTVRLVTHRDVGPRGVPAGGGGDRAGPRLTERRPPPPRRRVPGAPLVAPRGPAARWPRRPSTVPGARLARTLAALAAAVARAALAAER